MQVATEAYTFANKLQHCKQDGLEAYPADREDNEKEQVTQLGETNMHLVETWTQDELLDEHCSHSIRVSERPRPLLFIGAGRRLIDACHEHGVKEDVAKEETG